MGNVQASSAPSSSTPSSSPPSPPLTAPPPPTSGTPEKIIPTPLVGNPGTFEELHKKCKDVFPQCFEGAKLLLNKGISSHFQVSHSLALSSLTPGTYHFGATYVGDKQTGPHESFPVMVGDIDLKGNLNAQIIHQFTSAIRGKFILQTQKKFWAMQQVDAEYRGSDFTASLTCVNPDLFKASGIIVAHYLQSLSPGLSLGAEFLYHNAANQEAAVVSLAGQYKTDNWTACATVGKAGWHASYHHKGNENVDVGVQYEYNTQQDQSSVSLGYQFNVPKANLVFRGMMDTNWVVGAVLEKRFHPLPFTFSLAGTINHTKGESQFGFGLTVG
ncbi:mitochondrial import receptor subunit TOM40 homolog [Dendronephthya gigantea]|uniref:mitochondrial import receptor subunit TOM40 homolog n=1 Tax=Dendronephthya gigantea TaxID=151771 RepID=UPI00106DBECA|nr:mitochondrial import receptor subunit TOM40 homolog [Dendronephthya gigantea]